MRFIENGPNIPDELLFARDNGDVLFFCGAGVSQQKAKLPSFQGLVHRVCEYLSVGEAHPVKKFSEHAPAFENKIGISGLVSADRLFGLLEKDYGVAEIQRAVSLALKPQNDQVGPHETMLALATDSKQKVKLVTTNFDRLFERCDSELPIHCYPQLPNPSVADSMHGITYLHGFVDEKYETAESSVFVVSSADFGHAYLSEGWATEFIKSVLQNYTVVFVGYSADDPPVNYLLEALCRDTNNTQRMYAFAEGPEDEAEDKWHSKGVTPIVFNDFDMLWATLDEWAARAISPSKWYGSKIRLAETEPSKCSPIERGLVAHTVSCAEGMKLFATHSSVPHAEWLCVFDASIRYSSPGQIGGWSDHGDYFDPFSAYGIDSDSDVELFRNTKKNPPRRFPDGVWHYFSYTLEDQSEVGLPNGVSLTAYGVEVSNLPRRILWFRHWIGRLVSEPTVIWWALQQNKLHPDIKREIESAVERNPGEYSDSVILAWRLIFECWDKSITYLKSDADHYWQQIKKSGWSDSLLLRWAECARPTIEIATPFGWKVRPASKQKVRGLIDLLDAGVRYPEPCWSKAIEVPSEKLSMLVREYRKNLEHAVTLKRLIGDVHCSLAPINRDKKLEGSESGRWYGENGFFFHFVDLYEQLAKSDVNAAKAEMNAWPIDDDSFFARLRIWTAGQDNLTTSSAAASIFLSLSSRAFWDSRHRRDLLVSMKQRWQGFPDRLKSKIEQRITKGRDKYEYESTEELLRWSAIETLNVFYWLKQKGCDFSTESFTKIDALKQHATDWNAEWADSAADSLENRGGWVRPNKDCNDLKHLPVESIIDKAKEMSGRDFDILVEHDPFGGLVENYPLRAFKALTAKAEQNVFHKWAWDKFFFTLAHEESQRSRKRIAIVVAHHLILYSREDLSSSIYAIVSWFSEMSETLRAKCAEVHSKLWLHLAETISEFPEKAISSVRREDGVHDWSAESLNSPTGQLAETLFGENLNARVREKRVFPEDWLPRASKLLTLDSIPLCHAIYRFGQRLRWFYWVDSEWTKNNLLSLLEDDSDQRRALLHGFLHSSNGVTRELFQELKPTLVKLVGQMRDSNTHAYENLAEYIALGWLVDDGDPDKRVISSRELHDLLLNSDRRFRMCVVRRISRTVKTEHSDDSELDNPFGRDAENRAIEFLKQVWPKHKKLKTNDHFQDLFRLTTSLNRRFPEAANEIISLFRSAPDIRVHLYELLHHKSEIIRLHPNSLAKLVVAFLPTDKSQWPYDLGELVEKIDTDGDGSFEYVERLRTIWNSVG